LELLYQRNLLSGIVYLLRKSSPIKLYKIKIRFPEALLSRLKSFSNRNSLSGKGTQEIPKRIPVALPEIQVVPQAQR
jgi:hypothetical protein